MSGARLAGKRALVTGASSGIGAGIARALAAAGAEVAINYSRDEKGAAAVARSIEAAGGRASVVKADVSSEADVLAMFDAVGDVDVLVNNAGIQKDAPFAEMTVEDWNRVIGVNLTGQFLCSREVVRRLVKRNRPGSILCISSVHDVIPWAGHANYAASKGGVMMLMKTMAQELADKKIRVNASSPGAINTPINTEAWSTPEAEAKLLKLIPYGRVGEVEDIGKAAVWLASDDADYVTGATLYVDGGMTLYPAFREGG
jgi:glucose 1-dehydrogenase